MVAAAGVVVHEPCVGLGLQLSQAREPAPVERRSYHSCSAVPWNRSQTALWLGERGGIRWWAMPRASRPARKLAETHSGPLSLNAARTPIPTRANRRRACSRNRAATSPVGVPRTSSTMAHRVAVSTAVSW